MRLLVWAGRISPETADHFAELLGLGSNPETERSAYNKELAGRLASPEWLRASVRRLRPWTVEVLKVAAGQFATFPFNQMELEQAAFREGISGAHVKASLAVLKRQGLLLGLRKAWGEDVYLIPEDTLGSLQDLLFGEGLTEAPNDEGVYGEEIGNTGCAAYHVLEALRFLEQGIRVTRQGGWPKPMARKLQKELALTDDDVAALELRLRPGIGLGPAAGLILDLAIRSGLIQLDGEIWKRRGSSVREWVLQPLPRAQRHLYRLWRQITRSSEVWEAHFFACLEKAEAGRWYNLGTLFEWLRDCDMMKRIGCIGEPELIHARLLPMQALGWIRLRKTEDGRFLFQVPFPLSEDSPDQMELYTEMIVQTDMELILPPWPPLALLWKVMEWCVPVSRGEMPVLRLDADRIRRATGNGTGPEEIIRVLEQYSCMPLDPSVRNTIETWSGGCKAVIRTHAAVLLLKDGASRELAEECTELKDLGLEKLADGIYLIPARLSEAAALVLRGLGLIVAQASGGLPVPEQKAEDKDTTDAAPAGLIMPAVQEPLYAPSLITSLPDPSGWEKAPTAWFRTLASYHPSTRKDMIRQAIAWRTPIRLVGDSGMERVLIPTGIRETGGGWMVEGMQDKAMTAVHSGEWEKIQIIIPGAGD